MSERDAILNRCMALTEAIAFSQDGGAIRDMEARLVRAQAELAAHDSVEPE